MDLVLNLKLQLKNNKVKIENYYWKNISSNFYYLCFMLRSVSEVGTGYRIRQHFFQVIEILISGSLMILVFPV
jgi:hypothetical protein